jgi:ribosomal protein S12 methylthiotransferase
VRSKNNNVCLITLGCPKNIVEGENILGIIRKKGYTLTADLKTAGTVIVHTCSFIEDARNESIDTIRAISKLKENGTIQKLIVTGCMVQDEKRNIQNIFPSADSFVGTGELHNIDSVLDVDACYKVSGPGGLMLPKAGRVLSSDLPVAYLKLSEGCNHRCSFCIIPQLRGRYRSRNIGSVVSEADSLAQKGIKELVLIAQDTTFYGHDIYKKSVLAKLVDSLSSVEGIKWIRLLYAYPGTVREELLDIIEKNPKVCKYLDMPLQHVSKRVLEKMRRPVNSAQTVSRIIDRVPDIALRTTFITGFPGETDKDFGELYDFVSRGLIEHLGVFVYSDNKKAESHKFGRQVPEKIKFERQKELMLLQKKIVTRKNKARVGRKIEVLVEQDKGGGEFFARAAFQAPEIDSRVRVKGNFRTGEFADVTITGVSGYDIKGV